jgi:NTE family protein
MVMKIDDLIGDKIIQEELAKLTSPELRKKKYSDVIDEDGLQYIDLVMEGGGMLGIALVGYTWALEQAGLRFLGIGGTSAGSINALLLASLGEPSQPKSPKLLEVIANQNFFEFIDGGPWAKQLVKVITAGASKMPLAIILPPLIPKLLSSLGINPGKSFENWLTGLLKNNGIHTLSDLKTKMATVPKSLHVRPKTDHANRKPPEGRLALVAADVSTETKVVFPKMANLYFKDPEKVNPAHFARASMSIPYFFEPLKIPSLPLSPHLKKLWKEVGFYIETEKGLPEKAVFIDGGIMSNFPIDTFHTPKSVPRMPTFGVKLEYDNRKKKISSPGTLFGAIFNSARHCLDYDFIRRNPDFRHLVQRIPCQGYNWLNFDMSDEEKKGLFKEGALCAFDFLKSFDWDNYKEIRKQISRTS